VPDDVLESVTVVVVGGVTLTVEPGRTATFELVERARAAGCRVLFDPNVRPELWEVDPASTVRRALSVTDFLKVSREDLVDGPLPEEPEQLLDAGPDAVFLTEGDDGARLVATADSPWGRGEWRHDGYRVADVVDTTGAGDAFAAGVVAGLVDGATPEELLGIRERRRRGVDPVCGRDDSAPRQASGQTDSRGAVARRLTPARPPASRSGGAAPGRPRRAL